MDPLSLDGKVAVVTGASRGLGRACATELARRGARVVISARNEDALRATAEEISSATNATVLPVPCDTTQREESTRLIETVIEKLSSLDILVINVPHPTTGGFFDLGEDAWLAGFEQILQPAVHFYRLVLPLMKKQGWGRIITISSSAVREPNSTYLLSGVFRTANAWLSKALANEFGQYGVTVNTVCPGLFRTPLGEELIERAAARQGISPGEAEAGLANLSAVRRIGDPEQLAALVGFLSTDAANHMTGQVITIDGGKARGLF